MLDIPWPAWERKKLDGEYVIWIYCPKCSQRGLLDDHIILSDGTVTPSVVCGNEGCDFHEQVRLTGKEDSSQ